MPKLTMRNYFAVGFLVNILLLCPLELKTLKTFQGARAPKSVEIAPDGSYAAIMNLEGLDFWLIDTKTLKFIKKAKYYGTPAKGWDYKKQKPIKSLAQKPVECTFSQGGRFLWVSLHNAAAVTVFDTTGQYKIPAGMPFERLKIKQYPSGAIVSGKAVRIATGKTPKIIKVTPDGRYALVANWHSSSITIIDARTFKKIKALRVGGLTRKWYIPRGIAISPDSRTAYVANMGGGTISVIDLETLTVSDDFRVTPNPRHIVMSTNGRHAYLSDNRGGKVLQYDLKLKKTLKQVYIGRKARSLALSPDEKYVFAVSHDDSLLAVIDTASFSVILKKKFSYPMGIAITPDGSQLWVTSYRGSFFKVFKVIY